MRKQKQKSSKLFLVAGIVIIFTIFLFNFKPFCLAETISVSANNSSQIQNLQEDVEARKLEIEKIEKKLKVYEDSLEQKRAEQLTLRNELEILSEKIEKLELQIKANNLQIDTTNLEIQSILLQILDKEDQISLQKSQLAELIRLINHNDDKGYLEILASNSTFSDFFDEVTQTKTVQKELKKSLDEIKALKKELETQQYNLEAKSVELKDYKTKLEQAKAELDQQESAKTYYLASAKKSEKKFQSLIEQSKVEQQKINSEIVSLEQVIRKRLAAEGEKVESTGQFMWPVPQNVITTFFHDPDYPFRYIFEHPAIDIRAAQGTPVKAADSGYVATAKDGGSGYSYIMLVHDNGLATVYGHVSKIYVQTDTYVNKGDIIGLSGGTPGTHGAGRLTTGPHLHFEVRLNGIPVNPMDYL